MTSTLRTATLLLGFLALGCGSTPDEGERPKAVDVSQRPRGPLETNPNDVGATYRPRPTRAQPWKDETKGVSATLVYVTRMGTRNNPKPAAIIFSSDPKNNFFMQKASPQFTVRRLYRAEMSKLLKRLKASKFDQIPWSDQPDYDAKIGPQRGLHFYREGKRVFALKDRLDLQSKLVFREVEDRIIRITMGR